MLLQRTPPLPIDALFVEASGLAKPNPLLEIMQWADTRSDQPSTSGAWYASSMQIATSPSLKP